MIGGQREFGAANCGHCGGPDRTGPAPPPLRLQHIEYRSFGSRQSGHFDGCIGAEAVRAASRSEGPDTVRSGSVERHAKRQQRVGSSQSAFQIFLQKVLVDGVGAGHPISDFIDHEHHCSNFGLGVCGYAFAPCLRQATNQVKQAFSAFPACAGSY